PPPATGSEDKRARLWNVPTGEARGEPLVHRSRVWAVAFRPDGKALAARAENEVWLWDLTEVPPRGKPMAHPGSVAFGFSPDGKILATAGGGGDADKTARLWDT